LKQRKNSFTLNFGKGSFSTLSAASQPDKSAVERHLQLSGICNAALNIRQFVIAASYDCRIANPAVYDGGIANAAERGAHATERGKPQGRKKI
jgi:hypothetical protein